MGRYATKLKDKNGNVYDIKDADSRRDINFLKLGLEGLSNTGILNQYIPFNIY